jgi:hypothetical protein
MLPANADNDVHMLSLDSIASKMYSELFIYDAHKNFFFEKKLNQTDGMKSSSINLSLEKYCAELQMSV